MTDRKTLFIRMHSGHLTAFRFKQTPAARLSVQSSIVSGAWQHIATFKRMSYMTFLACGARPYSIRCHSCISQCSGAKLNSGELGTFHNSLAMRSCSQHFASSKHLQRRSKFNCTRGDLIIRLHCYHAHSSSLQANTCNDVLRSLHSHLSAATLPSNVSIV